MSTDVKYFVKAILDAEGDKMSTAISGVADSIVSASNRMAGAAMDLATMFAKVGVAIGGAATAAAVDQVVRGGFEYNALLEAGNNKIASSLRLFDHLSPGVEATADAAAKFAANIDEARAISKELVTIADASPGSYLQVSGMFQNMLPTLRSVTGDMNEILDVTKRSALLAGVMGGEFEQVGSQIGMLVSGTAGKDIGAYRLLQPTLRKALVEAKKLKETATDKDMLEMWNQTLTGTERIEYLKKGLAGLGPEVAAMYEKSWEGASSSAQSKVKDLFAGATKGLFEETKSWMVELTSGDDGILKAGTDINNKLKAAADYFGVKLATWGSGFFKLVENSVVFFANNFETIIDGLERAFRVGINVAKIMLAANAAKGAMGVVGSALGAAYGAGQTIGYVVQAIGNLGISGAVALPIMIALGLALAGVAVVFAGVAAYFIQHWDEIFAAIQEGTVTLAPVFDAIDLLWVKLLAVGEVFLGVGGVAGNTQGFIDGVAGALKWLMGVMSDLIRWAGYVHGALSAVINGLRLVYMGFTAVIQGILWGIKGLIDSVNSWIELESLTNASSSLGGAMDTLSEHQKGVAAAIQDNVATTSKFFEAADKFDAAMLDGEGITSGIRKTFEEQIRKIGSGRGGGLAGKKPPNINIHSMSVVNDFRNEDPDRIMGAFVEKLEDVTMKPTQASTLDDFGG